MLCTDIQNPLLGTQLVLCCIVAAGRQLLGTFWIKRGMKIWHKTGYCWFVFSLCLYSGAFSFLGVMPLVSCSDQSPGVNGGYSNQVCAVPLCILQNSNCWITSAGSQLVLAWLEPGEQELPNYILTQAALEMYNQAMNYYYLYYLHWR